MKRLITALVLCTVSGGLSAAQSQDKYEELANELEIMSGVLNTSLRQTDNVENWRVSKIETRYLAGQGAVFTLSLRGQSGNWVHEIETLVEGFVGAVPSAPPAPPIPHFTGSLEEMDEIVMEATREWESYAEATSTHFSNAFADNSDRMRDLRNMQRELAWEAREAERELRDITFELRHADEERKAALLKEKEKTQQKLADVQTKADKMKEELKAVEKEQKAQLAKRKEKQQQAYKAFLAGFEESVSETLCRFGAGLRGLPQDEHISMVLKDFEVEDNRARKDRIYVFSRKDVVRCVQEKIDANKLLSNAEVYKF